MVKQRSLGENGWESLEEKDVVILQVKENQSYQMLWNHDL